MAIGDGTKIFTAVTKRYSKANYRFTLYYMK